MLVPSKLWRRLFLAGVGFVCSIIRCGAAPAQDVGTVVALRGPVEIGRGGAWMPAVNGMPVQLGDEVRTGAGGRVSLTFQDGTVLSAADQSRVVIDQQVFGGTGGPSHGMFRLLQGLVRSVVTAYYSQPGSVYEIGTPTAVVGVRGTEFIVAYDPVTDVSDVVGVDGQVAVYSAGLPGYPGRPDHGARAEHGVAWARPDGSGPRARTTLPAVSRRGGVCRCGPQWR